MDRVILAAIAEYVTVSQKVIADLMEKYSENQPRVPAGEPGGGRFGPGEAYDAGMAASDRAGRSGKHPDLTAAEDRFIARHGSEHVNHFTQGWSDHATDRPHANRPGTPPAVEWFEPAVGESHFANGWWGSQAENEGPRGGKIPVYDLRHQSQPENSLVFESRSEAMRFAQTHPGGTEQKGDVSGHEFHGNRFTGGIGGGQTRNVTAKMDKQLQAKLTKFGITPEMVAGNLKSEWARAQTNGGREEGMRWYSDAANQATEAITKMGGPSGEYYTRAQAVAMVAATSPQLLWDDEPATGARAGERTYPNLELATACAQFVSENPVVNITQEDADRFNDHPKWFTEETEPNPMVAGQFQVHPDPESNLPRLSTDLIGHVILQPSFGLQGLPSGATKALDIALGADIDETLSGDKVRSFYTNLINPDNDQAVTVDTWMTRIALGSSLHDYYEAHPDEKVGKAVTTEDRVAAQLNYIVSKPAGYNFIADSIRAQAKAEGVLPQQYQAATWISARKP